MTGLVLGGRSFAPVDQSTVKHDEHVMGLYLKSALAEVAVQPGETPSDAGERAARQFFASTEGRQLLAALLVPVVDGAPVPWSLEVEAEVYDFLGTLSTPEDKDKFNAAMRTVMQDFLVAAPPRSTISTTSSSATEEGGETE